MYDALIIGSGIGGLICGCNLAKNGVKTAIFEQHYIPGGCCTSFKRKGFNFDAAAHLLGECSERGSLNLLLNNVGIDYDFISFPDNEVIYLDNKRYVCPPNIKEYSEFLKNIFCEEKDNIEKFFLDIKRRSLINEINEITYESFLDSYFKNWKLKRILSAMWLYAGIQPDKLSAGDGIDIFKSYWKEGAYYPLGGAQKFSNAIVKKFKYYGGNLFLSTKVVKISKLKENYIVTLSNGNTVKTKYVINNGDLKSLKKMCTSDIKFNNDIEAYIDKGEESRSLFSTYWALKCRDDEVNIGGWYLSNDSLNYDNDMLITVPTLYDKSLCSDGYNIIQTFSIDNNSGKESKLYKVRKKMRNIIPDFDEKVVLVESSDYKTIKRYTLNHNGSPYGWKHSIEQGGNKRMNSILGKNLYQTGHWTKPGSGIKSAVISGILVSRNLLGKD